MTSHVCAPRTEVICATQGSPITTCELLPHGELLEGGTPEKGPPALKRRQQQITTGRVRHSYTTPFTRGE